MEFKLWFFIFICSLVSGTCFAQNKVVVVPFFDDTAVLTCKGTIVGTRWCDQENGTVKDMTTGLIWLKNAAGAARKFGASIRCATTRMLHATMMHIKEQLL